MLNTRLNLLTLLILLGSFENVAGSECHVSKPNIEAPEPLVFETPGLGWYGDENLAALIPIDGIWQGMGANYNFRNKFFWWEKNNSLNPDNQSRIEITAINLINNSEMVEPVYAVNIYSNETMSDWGGMLTAIEFPSSGCWKIVGRFKEHEIQFTVLVGNK